MVKKKKKGLSFDNCLPLEVIENGVKKKKKKKNSKKAMGGTPNYQTPSFTSDKHLSL